ncbi:hypothetical protein BDV26DRAFT_288147 [Aspergillus bertholletiae]|uniref:Uncharacterized protein n=1 Tax=Aspergillus bertholletiae TaxID=1226010 RepID=A0A5N7BM09_9EURO|nr:hypothetical protein BDV26DRAFT_288147 [Aspergillus bertholletiae]
MQQPFPNFYIIRHQGPLVPLIPLDELPSWLQVGYWDWNDTSLYSAMAPVSSSPIPRIGEYDVICHYCSASLDILHRSVSGQSPFQCDLPLPPHNNSNDIFFPYSLQDIPPPPPPPPPPTSSRTSSPVTALKQPLSSTPSLACFSEPPYYSNLRDPFVGACLVNFKVCCQKLLRCRSSVTASPAGSQQGLAGGAGNDNNNNNNNNNGNEEGSGNGTGNGPPSGLPPPPAAAAASTAASKTPSPLKLPGPVVPPSSGLDQGRIVQGEEASNATGSGDNNVGGAGSASIPLPSRDEAQEARRAGPGGPSSPKSLESSGKHKMNAQALRTFSVDESLIFPFSPSEASLDSRLRAGTQSAHHGDVGMHDLSRRSWAAAPQPQRSSLLRVSRKGRSKSVRFK